MKKICKRLLLAVVAVTLLFTLNGCGEKKVKQYSIGMDMTQYVSKVFKESMEKATDGEGGQEASAIINKLMAGTNNLADLLYKEKGYNVYGYYNFNKEGKLTSIVIKSYINTNTIKTVSKNVVDMMGAISGVKPEEINAAKQEIDQLKADELFKEGELEEKFEEGFKSGLKQSLNNESDVEKFKIKSTSKVLKTNKDVIEVTCKLISKKGTISVQHDKKDKNKSDYEKLKIDIKKVQKNFTDIKFSKGKTVYY